MSAADANEQAIAIRQATVKEACDFFYQTYRDRGIMPALFDPGRKCDVAYVAECGGHNIGAITLAFEGANGPTLDSEYVLPEYRRQHIGRRLCETAMRHLQSERRTPVFCDVTSRGMHLTIESLLPDLRALLRVELTYQTYGEIDLLE
jgi:GNAT superfamily N-acetyltransferase